MTDPLDTFDGYCRSLVSVRQKQREELEGAICALLLGGMPREHIVVLEERHTARLGLGVLFPGKTKEESVYPSGYERIIWMKDVGV